MRINRGIDVFWPANPPPEITEVAFSYAFCQQTSQDFLERSDLAGDWIEHTSEWTLENGLSRSRGETVLIVLDPEIVISSIALERMRLSMVAGFPACGPVYNFSDFLNQRAVLNVPYVNVSTYLEMAACISQREKGVPVLVNELDAGCVLYQRDFLRTLDGGIKLDAVHRVFHPAVKTTAAVEKGALVHRFGSYYDGERDDLVLLVPETVQRVMDIGCAKGGYGRRLKEIRPDIYILGVELNPIMAQSARRYYDEIRTSSVESLDIRSSFDLINCGDVLEHLEDPWAMLKRIAGLLRTGGYLVLSIPNAGHWSLVRDLIGGRFEYIPVGLTCVSHIRWFTESTIRKALENAGFSIDLIQREQIPATPEGEIFIEGLCAATQADEVSLRTNEILIRAVKK